MLLLNKNNFNKKIFFGILFLCLLINNVYGEEQKYNLDLDSECKVNLECRSGCCTSGKCSETKECKSFANTVYIVQLIICVVLIAIFIIVLIVKLKSINTDFQEKLKQKESMAFKNN